MHSHDTLAYAQALTPDKLRASLDRAGRVAPAHLGVCYVADDHGLGRDITRICLVQPDILLEQTFTAMAG